MKPTANVADTLASKAVALGIDPDNAAEELADVIDILTGGELDDVQMGVMMDMVLTRLPTAKPCRKMKSAREFDGGPSRDEFPSFA